MVIAVIGVISGREVSLPWFSFMGLPRVAATGDETPLCWLRLDGASMGWISWVLDRPANPRSDSTTGCGHDRFTVFYKRWWENPPFWLDTLSEAWWL
jgi:hypothetical protein